MATKIQMNLLNSSGNYEVLYPQTDYSNVLNTPTIPDTSNFVTNSSLNSTLSSYITSPAAIYEGGTGATNASNAIYNLINEASVRDNLINRPDNNYVPFCGYNSGYKISADKICMIRFVDTYSISTSTITAIPASIALSRFFFVFQWGSGTLTIESTAYNGGTTIFVKAGTYNVRNIFTSQSIATWNISVTGSTTTTLDIIAVDCLDYI